MAKFRRGHVELVAAKGHCMEVVNCADDSEALRRSWVGGRNWEVLSTERGETTDG